MGSLSNSGCKPRNTETRTQNVKGGGHIDERDKEECISSKDKRGVLREYRILGTW